MRLIVKFLVFSIVSTIVTGYYIPEDEGVENIANNTSQPEDMFVCFFLNFFNQASIFCFRDDTMTHLSTYGRVNFNISMELFNYLPIHLIKNFRDLSILKFCHTNTYPLPQRADYTTPALNKLREYDRDGGGSSFTLHMLHVREVRLPGCQEQVGGQCWASFPTCRVFPGLSGFSPGFLA